MYMASKGVTNTESHLLSRTPNSLPDYNMEIIK